MKMGCGGLEIIGVSIFDLSLSRWKSTKSFLIIYCLPIISQDVESRRLKRGHVLAELLETERIYVAEMGSILKVSCLFFYVFKKAIGNQLEKMMRFIFGL
jgi:hypothetical protein